MKFNKEHSVFCSKSIDRHRCQLNGDQNLGFFFWIDIFAYKHVTFELSTYLVSHLHSWIITGLSHNSVDFMLLGRKFVLAGRSMEGEGTHLPRLSSCPPIKEFPSCSLGKNDMKQKKGRNMAIWRVLGIKHEAKENYTLQ